MAIRNIIHVLKKSNVNNQPLPNTLILGEPIVNSADGILYFSGNSSGNTQGWTSAGTGTTANFFEVGSNLYDLQLRHRITKYDNISTTGLTGKFLSGTTNGFILANISSIQGVDTYVTGGTYSNGTTIFTNNLGGAFAVTGYVSFDTYVTGGTFSAGTTIFTNNSGGTFAVTGYASLDTYVTGGTYNQISGGSLTFRNNTGGTFSVSGIYSFENVLNKQNSMTYDGTGIKFPTVDAVNIQANNLARATIQTGFIDTSDGFTMYVASADTLGISGSTIGIAFSQLFKVPPFTPSSAIVQLTSRLVPLSGIGLTGTGSDVKFVGYRQSDDSIIFSDISFVQSPTICQLGVVLVKFSAGTITFIDSTRNFINQPDISAYSNLETTGFGIKSSVIVNHNGTDLKIKNTGGSLIGISVNWHGNNNDLKPILVSEPTGTTFTYLYPGSALSVTPVPFVSDIDPTRYWNGTALTQVGIVSAATVQRFLVNIRGIVNVQYSEFVYPSFNDALNNATVQTFSDVLPMGTFAEVGRLIVTSGCTDLSDTSKAIFLTTGSGGGGGGSTVSPTVVAWGSITGSITDQTDLQSALDGKQPLLTNPITGTGTTNNLAKFNNITGLTDSNITDTGSLITLNSATRTLDGFTAVTIVKSGGTSDQFLKADGSISTLSSISGITGTGVSGQVSYFNDVSSIAGSTGFTWNNSNQRLSINGTSTGSTLDIFSVVTSGAPDNVLRINGSSIGISLAINATRAGGTGQSTIYFQKNGVNTWTYGSDVNANGTKDFFVYDATSTVTPFFITATDEVRLGGDIIGLGGRNNQQKMTIKTNGNVLIGGTGDTNERLQVTGSTKFIGTGTTATTVLISSSTQNSLVVVGSGNSSTLPIFSVQGSQGELFSVNDSLIGSLFSVNDISGLPIIEAFSDNTILMGSFQAPSLNTTVKILTTVTGLTTIYSIPTSAYTGAWCDYTVNNGASLRAGTVMSVFSGSNVQFTETSTTDIGNTSGITFSMVISGSSALLRASGVTSGWTVKSIIRSI